MALTIERDSSFPAKHLLVLGVVTAVLYLARDVLIPLALAVLFSFVLAPAVRRLELWRLPRVPATLAVTGLALALILSAGYVTGNQLLSLVGKLPEYKENIARKLHALRSPPQQGQIARAAKAIKELEKETRAPDEPPKPAPVDPTPLPATPLELIPTLGIPVLTVLATALAVIIFTILMLLQRDDLRDRLIRLAGEGRINRTTQAIEDASGRVSRYLLMQLLVNSLFGVSLGAALYLVGLPNAALWGLLGCVLRFVPYVGAWAAAALPILLAFAIAEGWSLVAWTAGVIVVLEFTVAYAIEPWLYGHSTGLSPLAVVASAIFWTWLWGPIGLLLAVPVTVCVAAIGRHIPQLGFLNILLGVEPVLTADLRLYHRLLALEYEEATELAEQYAREHGIPALYDNVMLPALMHAKRELNRYAIDDRHERFFFDSMLQIMDELAAEREPDAAPAANLGEKGPAPDICIIPAHDEADYIAGVMLARVLAPEKFQALLLQQRMLAAEVLDHVAGRCEQAVCISAVPPSAAAHAGYLCKRLRRRFPKQQIVVVLWQAEGDLEAAAKRLREAGADEVVTRLPQAVERIRSLAMPARLAKQASGG